MVRIAWGWGNMIIRKLKKSDNLKQAAKLIYLTDPYIYPYWFEDDIEKGIQTLTQMLQEPTIFSYKNCIAAIVNKQVVGLIVYVTKNSIQNKNLEKYKQQSFSARYTIEQYIEHLYSYNETKDVSIAVVCVLPEFRRHKIASGMMEYLIQMFGEKTTYTLERLKDNVPAGRLYEKYGFTILKETTGFAGYGKPEVAICEMVRKKDV